MILDNMVKVLSDRLVLLQSLGACPCLHGLVNLFTHRGRRNTHLAAQKAGLFRPSVRRELSHRDVEPTTLTSHDTRRFPPAPLAGRTRPSLGGATSINSSSELRLHDSS